ncbi:MAG: hypothetical protein ACQEWV_32445 [Bacillota bacterium]
MQLPIKLKIRHISYTKQNMSLEQAIKLAVELNSENEVATTATIEKQPKAPIEQLCQRIEQLEINQSKLVEVNIQDELKLVFFYSSDVALK